MKNFYFIKGVAYFTCNERVKYLSKKKRIRLSDFDVLAKSMNIPETAVRNTYNKFSSGNKEVGEMITASFLSPEKKEQYLEIWNTKQRLF